MTSRQKIAAGLLLIVMIAAGALFGYRRWRSSRVAPIPPTRIAERNPADAATPRRQAVEDWPRWLGPRGDGVSREEDIADAWPQGGPHRVWSAEVGLGYASPIAVDHRVYLFSYHNGQEALTAFDAHTGRIVWNSEAGAGWSGSHPGTRATPVVEGQRVYTFGGGGDLICRDLVGGSIVWQVNILTATGSRNLRWGLASTPLLSNGLIYVQGGSEGPTCVAVRATDGAIAWQSEARTVAGYAHPIFVNAGERRQLIVFAGDWLYGMDAASGKTRWAERWPTKEQVNSAPPVYGDGYLFVTSAEGHGSKILRLTAQGATTVWSSREIQCYFQPPLLEGGRLYLNDEGALTCLAFPGGQTLWAVKNPGPRLGFGGSFVRIGGDRMIVLSARGKLALIRTSATGVERLAESQAIEGTEIYATPLVYGGRLYIKGMQELVCFDLADQAAGNPAATDPAAGH